MGLNLMLYLTNINTIVLRNQRKNYCFQADYKSTSSDTRVLKNNKYK